MSNESPVALVTGGATGIGRAAAREFLGAGYRVAICGRTKERIDEAVGALEQEGSVLGLVADVGDPAEAAGVVDRTVAEFGGLDTLTNAHGVIGSFTSIEELTPEGWQEVMATNLMGAIYTTTAAIPHRRERAGSVVNVASISALQAEPMMAPYGVAKAALVAFTRYAACELAADRVRVNAIAPGWIRTPMGEPFFEEAGVGEDDWATNFLGRAGEPEEMATLITFLSGPGASFITGETVVADGGHAINMYPLKPRDED
jgi:NAD(P)-dependent dehydrogenase (short-subunit alcohol dehydrogenase family)